MCFALAPDYTGVLPASHLRNWPPSPPFLANPNPNPTIGRPFFSPRCRLTRHTDNTTKPVCVAGESMTLKFSLVNPLHVKLVLRKVTLIANIETPGTWTQ
jgi:hypothetical protein